MSGMINKFKAVFYGPGWFPGAPKLGFYEQLPEVDKVFFLQREKPINI